MAVGCRVGSLAFENRVYSRARNARPTARPQQPVRTPRPPRQGNKQSVQGRPWCANRRHRVGCTPTRPSTVETAGWTSSSPPASSSSTPRRGLVNEPQRCPSCRAVAKQNRALGIGNGGGGGQREMHAAVCAECGGQALVPFLPRNDRPVYCRAASTRCAPPGPSPRLSPPHHRAPQTRRSFSEWKPSGPRGPTPCQRSPPCASTTCDGGTSSIGTLGSTPFHDPAWAQLVADCYGFDAFAAALIAEDGEIRAGAPMVAVRHLGRRPRWVSLPFTDYCPPLAASPHRRSLRSPRACWPPHARPDWPVSSSARRFTASCQPDRQHCAMC